MCDRVIFVNVDTATAHRSHVHVHPVFVGLISQAVVVFLMKTTKATANMTISIQNFINGAFMSASDGASFNSVNPATGLLHANLPDSPAADVHLAANAASRAFPVWSATLPVQRAEIMLRIADLIERQLDDFALAESLDQGKPVSLAKSVDIPRAAWNFRYFARLIQAGVGQDGEIRELQERDVYSFTQKKAAGVAGLISPWNL